MDLIRDIVEIFNWFNIDTEIIAASIRHPLHVLQAAKAGADIATVPMVCSNRWLSIPRLTKEYRNPGRLRAQKQIKNVAGGWSLVLIWQFYCQQDGRAVPFLFYRRLFLCILPCAIPASFTFWWGLHKI